MKASVHRLGALQLKILKELWDTSEATVAQIHDAVGLSEGLAYTTIATMLRKMEARKLVTHRVDGRCFIYRALVTEQEVSGTMSQDLLDRVFQGSLANMVSHFLTTREISKDEIGRLERLIKEKKGRTK